MSGFQAGPTYFEIFKVISGRLTCWAMIAIDPTAKLPPYRQAAEIADRIRCGQYPGESRLRSESDFMEEFELGWSTVRRSMAYLREQGSWKRRRRAEPTSTSLGYSRRRQC
jgi:hypothetical protein